ncbi:MAG: sigma-54-dependent Fis family transcriptional regulator [Fimbriimonadia bacterium]|jgi:DNA-binding NtrC family response regulator
MTEKRTTILIVDDEQNIRRILQAALERDGYRVLTAESGLAALDLIKSEAIDLIITDVMMPDMDGVELLSHVSETLPDAATILITAYGTIPQAVSAIRMGAQDYITKPFDLEVLRAVVTNALADRAESKKSPKRRGRKTVTSTDFVAESPAMRQVLEIVEQVASSRATVLLTGESGTGKEVVARMIHEQSPRSGKPFIAVSCAALPETLLEAELFGHEKGAYTGAVGRREGRFELADGGTLFLDEIGEVPLSVQVKLLRVIQERELERLGATKPVRVDVRLLAATNRDLHQAVDEGSFRADLFYRLQVVHIELPPLRDRPEDIRPLAQRFVQKYCSENGREPLVLRDEAIEALLNYRWPGNVRELENVIERAVVLARPDAQEIGPELLPQSLRAA